MTHISYSLSADKHAVRCDRFKAGVIPHLQICPTIHTQAIVYVKAKAKSLTVFVRFSVVLEDRNSLRLI